MNEKYQITGSKGQKQVKLEPRDLVWLHLRKERFPDLRTSKLISRANGCWGSIAGSYQTPTGKEKGNRTRKGKWH
jgi:hypothetical protein